VWRGEVELALADKESRCSSSHAPTRAVLSRFQLLEHAWDMAYDNRSNVITVHIPRLRRG